MDTTHSLFRTRATNSYIKAFAADKHVMSQRLVGVLRVAYKAKQLFHVFLDKYFTQEMSLCQELLFMSKSQLNQRSVEEVEKLEVQFLSPCCSWLPCRSSNPSCRSVKSNSIHSNYISKENSHPRTNTVESTSVSSESRAVDEDGSGKQDKELIQLRMRSHSSIDWSKPPSQLLTKKRWWIVCVFLSECLDEWKKQIGSYRWERNWKERGLGPEKKMKYIGMTEAIVLYKKRKGSNIFIPLSVHPTRPLRHPPRRPLERRLRLRPRRRHPPRPLHPLAGHLLPRQGCCSCCCRSSRHRPSSSSTS